MGTVRGDALAKLLINLGLKVGEHLDLSANGLVNIRTLFKGRIDLLSGNHDTTQVRLKSLGFKESDLKIVFDLTKYSPFVPCMALNKESDPRILERIKQAFSKYKTKHFEDFPIEF